MKPAWRLLFRLYRLFSWVRYVTLRRFTKTGLVLLAGFAATATMGVDIESTVAYQACVWQLCLLLVAFCGGWIFRAKFSAARQLPRFGTAGQPFSYVVAVRNRTARAQTGLALLEDFVDTRPGFEEWVAVQRAQEKVVRSMRFSPLRRSNPFKVATVKAAEVPALGPNEESEVRVEVTPLRRGVLRFAGVTLARSDPLGVFRALRKIPLPQATLILPKRYVVPPIALPGVLKYQEGGVALASNVGQSEEFVALRDYRRGDAVRHIHWRSWAKTGKPIVKEFADEFFVRHALVLDTFCAQPHHPAFEEAVSVAASFACTIQAQESLLDLLFVGAQAYCFTSGRGLAHADQMLEVLAAVQNCPEKPFQTLETLVLNHAAAVSGCVCVLLDWDAPRRAFVEKLKASGVPVLVVVVVAAPPATPLDLGPMRDEPEHFHTLVAGQIEEGLAKL